MALPRPAPSSPPTAGLPMACGRSVAGDPAYIPDLRQALAADPEEIVRSHAAWALGRMGTAEARLALETCRNDSSAAVQAEIARSLKRL